MTGTRLWMLLLLCLAAGARAGPPPAPLRVGGTGSGEAIVGLLFERFARDHPGAALSIARPPLGSSGGLRALAAARLDLAYSSRALTGAERAQLGQHVQLCSTAFVLATSDGGRAGGYSLARLADVYAGRLTRWDDGAPIRLVLRTADDSDSTLLASMSDAMGAAVPQAAARPGMVFAMDDVETLELIRRTPGALGPTNLGLISMSGGGLRLLPIDGVMPSTAALASGAYPWRKKLTVVLPAQPSALARQFYAFLQGPVARALLLRHDYLPPP
ncbi:MAG: substrate-binding domain-containing protein [Pseudomonadota bacterium]